MKIVRYYESNLNQVYHFISDPDLTINVDLGREEEEKNGRRKYKVYSKKTFRLEFCQMGFDSIWTLSFFYNVDEK